MRLASMSKRFVAIAAAALYLGFAGTRAWAAPTPAPTATPIVLPSLPPTLDPWAKTAIDVLGGIVKQQIINFRNSASGQVTYFKRFEMQIQTGTNQYRDVHLHQGTIINPRGATITVGQRVDVGGVLQQDGSIDANVITIQQ
jgi:hypothetical protein